MNTKKIETAYVCTSCGQDFSKWHGRCLNCGEWDTISEFKQPSKKSTARSMPGQPAVTAKLADCECSTSLRITSSFAEVDRVLGGGLVPGGLVLLGGDPGIGKSTLLMQLCASWAKQSHVVLYVSGEESGEQIYLRSSRLGLADTALSINTETSVETILSAIASLKPGIVVIDSIQTMSSDALESAPGSVGQVRECAAQLLRYAKNTHTAIILIGHVTKDGAIAGPRVLEHMVDTVLYFEGDSHYHHRIIRANKNRFGPAGEIAIFEMTDHGLSEIGNPSRFFLLHRTIPQIGTSIVPVLEGTRVLVVELQALVNKSHFGLPQRIASGINPKKLSLLLAVLERFGNLTTGEYDIFFNIVGGLSITEPAIDLGIAAALLSSFYNKPLRKDIAFIGELGLGGEIRPVNNMPLRLKELSGMGFTNCITCALPEQSRSIQKIGINLIQCNRIAEIHEHLF
jgi:DNA repair protein RadA/Sms